MEITQKDDAIITFTVRENGIAKNITGWDIKLILKNKESDLDADAIVLESAILSSPTTGVGYFDISTVQSDVTAKTYYMEIVRFDELGKRISIKKTTLKVKKTIYNDV